MTLVGSWEGLGNTKIQNCLQTSPCVCVGVDVPPALMTRTEAEAPVTLGADSRLRRRTLNTKQEDAHCDGKAPAHEDVRYAQDPTMAVYRVCLRNLKPTAINYHNVVMCHIM